MSQDRLPVLPYGPTPNSGWSGSDTSRERAEHDDATGVTGRRQRTLLTLLDAAGDRGKTWREAADGLGWHHGQVSGALSNLHSRGLVERLTERRGRSQVYVLPRYVLGREVTPRPKRKRTVLSPEQVEAVQWVNSLHLQSGRMTVVSDDQLIQVRAVLNGLTLGSQPTTVNLDKIGENP